MQQCHMCLLACRPVLVEGKQPGVDVRCNVLAANCVVSSVLSCGICNSLLESFPAQSRTGLVQCYGWAVLVHCCLTYWCRCAQCWFHVPMHAATILGRLRHKGYILGGLGDSLGRIRAVMPVMQPSSRLRSDLAAAPFLIPSWMPARFAL
jgi:hypothetical protein